MIRRAWVAFILGLVAAFAVALPAAAGGWASVLPDADPPPSDDGGTLIGFHLLQHGQTPVDFGEVTVIATNTVDGTVVRTFATNDRPGDGHWTARMDLASGSWTYTVTHNDLLVEMPVAISINTGAPAAPAAVGPRATAPASNAFLALVLFGSVLAVSVGAMGVVLVYQRRRGLLEGSQ